jgi:hypothetical protein
MHDAKDHRKPRMREVEIKEFAFDEFEEALAGRLRYVKPFAQDDWIASHLSLFKAVGKSPSETLYMVSLCSEVPLPEAGQEVILTSLYEMRYYLEEMARRDAEIERFKTDLSEQMATLAQRDADLAKRDALLAEKDTVISGLRGAYQDLRQQGECIYA